LLTYGIFSKKLFFIGIPCINPRLILTLTLAFFQHKQYSIDQRYYKLAVSRRDIRIIFFQKEKMGKISQCCKTNTVLVKMWPTLAYDKQVIKGTDRTANDVHTHMLQGRQLSQPVKFLK